MGNQKVSKVRCQSIFSFHLWTHKIDDILKERERFDGKAAVLFTEVTPSGIANKAQNYPWVFLQTKPVFYVFMASSATPFAHVDKVFPKCIPARCQQSLVRWQIYIWDLGLPSIHIWTDMVCSRFQVLSPKGPEGSLLPDTATLHYMGLDLFCLSYCPLSCKHGRFNSFLPKAATLTSRKYLLSTRTGVLP